jgi:hypothetical protein
MRKVDLILKIVRAYKHTILHLVCTKFSQNQFGSLHGPTAYLETTLEIANGGPNLRDIPNPTQNIQLIHVPYQE